MAAAEVGGVVEVQSMGGTTWQALSRGQKVVLGDQIRTGEAAYVLLQLNDQSSYVVGPDSLAAVARMSPGFENPTTILWLKAGSALATAQEPRLRGGALEIETPRAILSITAPATSGARPPKLASLVRFPSGYVGSGVVTIQPGVSADQARTQVGCLSGSCTVSVVKSGTSTKLDLSQYVEITLEDALPQPIPPELAAEAQRLGAYTLPQLIALLTGTPPALATLAATATPAATVQATWTLMPTLPGATATPTLVPLVAHQAATPDPNWSSPDGLTPEEFANRGTHVFSHTCRPYNKCVCSENQDTPEITLAFDRSGVTLSGVGGGTAGAITYPKAGPNLYALKAQGLEAALTFYVDGWDFVVTKNGAACSLQTFMLK
jgi:hypothetical protein